MKKRIITIKKTAIGDGIPKICVPITGSREKEILERARAAADAGPDLAEWRIDFWEDLLEEEKRNSLLSELGSLSLVKCVDFKPTDEAVTLCGFDEPQAALTARYLTDTGIEESLSLTIGGENLDQDGYYVRVNDDPTIYQMSSAGVDAILAAAAGGLTDGGETAE